MKPVERRLSRCVTRAGAGQRHACFRSAAPHQSRQWSFGRVVLCCSVLAASSRPRAGGRNERLRLDTGAVDDGEGDRAAETNDSEFARGVIDQMYDLFILPEQVRRGLPPGRDAIRKALVVLAPGVGVRVDLNDEAELAFQARSTRAMDAGQNVTVADIDPATVTGLRPVTLDPDAGWVALAQIPGVGVVVAFDFTRNRGRARRLLDKADAFGDQAEGALTVGHLSPALDLAFSAAELAVTAMMSLIEEPTGGRNQHGRRTSWFSQWTRLGNSPREFHQLLARLASLRPQARYGDSDPLTTEETERVVVGVRDLIDHARTRVGKPLRDLSAIRPIGLLDNPGHSEPP